MKRIRLTPILFMLAAISCMAQANMTLPELKTAEDSLHFQRKLFPQEQVFVMTDREMYLPGDTVWLRAWVVDSETKKQERNSCYLYVELRDAAGFLQKRVRLRADDNGDFSGYVPIDAGLASCTYTLIAYTYYMLGTNEQLLFRKPIDVLTTKDLAAGFTLSELKKGEYIDNVIYVDGDSDVSIEFDLPANGKYAASVTNVNMSPADSLFFITNQLPGQRILFNDKYIDIMRQVGFIQPTFAYEQGNTISGTLYGNLNTKKTKKNIDVSVVGLDQKFAGMAKTDENGHFSINVPDVFSDNDSTSYTIKAKGKYSELENITLDDISLPDKLAVFVPGRNRFTHKDEAEGDMDMKKWIADKYKNTIVLQEVEVDAKKIERKPRDFTHNSVQMKDKYGNLRFFTYTQVGTALAYHTRTNKYGLMKFYDLFECPISVLVDNQLIRDYDVNLLDAVYPLDQVKFIEYSKEDKLMNIVMMDYNDYLRERARLNIRVIKTMTCQKHHDFKPEYSEYAPPVIYWNPSVTPADGKARITFRTPDSSYTIYRVTLEGIADDGTLLHKEKYVQIKVK